MCLCKGLWSCGKFAESAFVILEAGDRARVRCSPSCTTVRRTDRCTALALVRTSRLHQIRNQSAILHILRAEGVPTRHTHKWDGLHTRHLLESTHIHEFSRFYFIKKYKVVLVVARSSINNGGHRSQHGR